MQKNNNFLKSFLVLMIASLICIGNLFDTSLAAKVSAAASSSPKVAELTIFSYSHYDIYMRHAFLSIKNITKKPLDIFYAPVPAGYSKTISTRSVSDSDLEKYGNGIYTNIEAFNAKYHGAYSTRVSLSIKIDEKQLKTINQVMRDNNKHNAVYNCTWFCAKAWNSVCPSNLKLGYGAPPNPNVLSKNIQKKPGYKTGASIGKCDLNNLTRFINSKKSIKIPPEILRPSIYGHVW